MNSLPTFIYGTAWKEERTAALVELALEAGFRAIDTANQRKHYFEEAAGKGIHSFLRKSGLDRDELFLQTKYTYQRGQDHRLPYDPKASYSVQVEQSFASSLEHLKVTRIDSYLLHGPFSGEGISEEDREVWRAMEKLCAGGVVSFLGVSNVSVDQLQELYSFAKVKPRFAQIRTYARRAWEKPLLDFCAGHGILYQGFSLLTANREELASQLVLELARKYGVQPAQVIFRFASQLGMIPVTGTSSAEHMRLDLESNGFGLTASEMSALRSLSAP
jgi:diketogulonate reductase-like aldo/keto reductase